MSVNSPLRYPGGKSVLTSYIEKEINALPKAVDIYAEPFAGGAGIATNLLLNNAVPRIYLNDADPAIFSIWNNIIFQTDDFIKTLQALPITIAERENQKAFYKTRNTPSFELGVAAYFLNRTNVSGVITGGPIGGANQNGKYKIDCRFNKTALIKKIEKIGSLRNRITLFNLDFEEFLQNPDLKDAFIYMDPPYVAKGKVCYRDSMSEADHIRLRDIFSRLTVPCLISYDNNDLINELYKGFDIRPVYLNYSAGSKNKAKEIIIRNNYLATNI